jgi:hypothetical protein
MTAPIPTGDSSAVLMIEALLRDRAKHGDGALYVVVRRRAPCDWVVTWTDGVHAPEQRSYSTSGSSLLDPRHRERDEDPDICPQCGAGPGEGAEYERPDPEVGFPGGWDGCETCIRLVEDVEGAEEAHCTAKSIRRSRRVA